MKLTVPTMEYEEQIMAFRREFLESGDSMDGGARLRKCESVQEWLDQLEPDTSQFLYVREEDGKVVGILQIRHRFNAYLEKYAGHIGYAVCPGERRKGYATRMLAAALAECVRIGINDVLITCLKDNEASRRTILRNGGEYESDVWEPDMRAWIERYWVHLGEKRSHPADPFV